jgi:hypothetical protein
MANGLPIGSGTTVLGLGGTADVGDEVGRSGLSFGKLVELTGKAVADTQLKLNQTGAATASALATTQVDVIAVQESIYDDQGNLAEAQSHVRHLPLINFVDPVFYEWSEVRLRGEFYAQEFVASSEQKGSTYGSGDNLVGSGVSFILGPGLVSFGSSSTQSASDLDTSSDRSYGRIRASALLTPKRDIGVPKPRQVLRGPSLSVIAGEVKDVLTAGKVTGRTQSALIELRKLDGSPIADKAISIETQGVAWSFAVPGEETTDANGQVAIVLTREFLSDDADHSPTNVVVTARLGLVSNATTLTF